MNLKELKTHEAGLLSSNKSNLIEYGKAYRDILKKCERSSDPWLSDEVLISDKAIEFIEELKNELKIKNDENLKLQIYAASKLIIKNFLSKNQVKQLLDFYEKDYYDFNSAREILKSSPDYCKISPKTLCLILDEISKT